MTIAPPLTEAAFMAQVTQYAELRNWEWVHCRAGRTVDSWRTPMSGTMAKGFPDLVLVREPDRRLIFVELKRAGGRLSVDQERVLDVLRALEYTPGYDSPEQRPVVDVHVWRPADWPEIERELA